MKCCHKWLIWWIAMGCVAAAMIAMRTHADKELLNPEERAWLNSHPNIRLAYEPNYAPICFVDPQEHARGLSVEYVQLVEKKLGYEFTLLTPQDLDVNQKGVHEGQIDVITSVMQTPARSEYMNFTKPYLKLPTAIVVRKDFKDSLTLDKMRGMKIAVVDGYAIKSYLETNFPCLELVSAKDEITCLELVSFRNVDAAVIDMASTSDIIQSSAISNLHVAGRTDFTYDLCLASRKDWPLLNTILDKGLADITPSEHDTIRKKWILMNQESSISKTVWIIICSTLALGSISMLVVLAWNRSLARIVTKRSIELTAELTHRRQAEESMRKTLAEKETLIRELYHRTKNNLQIVSSLMNLKTHKSAPETRTFVSEINQRIQGLSLIHQMLYESHDLSTLDLSDYLKKLVDLIVLNLWGQRSAVTVNFSADVLPVTLDIASPCGLVINELLSNTFKYAFADGRHGVITIKLSLDGPGRILIEYSDNGVGLPDGFDPRQQLTLGFQSLFAIIEHQLAGDVRVISNHGLGFIMKIASTHYKERV